LKFNPFIALNTVLETKDSEAVVRSDDIVRALNVKDNVEAMKVFNLALAWLVGLKAGSKLETTFVNFHKIDSNTLVIENKTEHKDLITVLHDFDIITVVG
jgi:hypothetical protein